MRVLVTGGGGYVGSHAAVALADAGHEVEILDNLERGHREIAERAASVAGVPLPLHVVDLTDQKALHGVLAGGFDAVVHCAALKSVAESVEHPDRYGWNNMVGTRLLATTMLGMQIPRLVFASSGSVYGANKVMLIDEDAELKPLSPYGASKVDGERSCHMFTEAPGMGAVALRFFNVCGAHPGGELGEMGDSPNLVPRLLRQLDRPKPEIKLFGTKLATRDGTCIRDYVHVCDVASAVVASVESLAEPDGLAIYNVGTGTGSTVREVVSAVATASGREIAAIPAPPRTGDPVAQVADVRRIHDDLGWQSAWTLDDMVRHALAWRARRG